MPMLDRVRAWFRGERAIEPVNFYPTAPNFFGPGISNQPSHDRLLQENIGMADAATRAIANRVSTLEPLVKVERRITSGTTEEEILDDHPLKLLLDRPHPNFTRAQLMRLTAQYIVTVGEAYWLKVGNGMGVPTELHPAPPGNMSPLVSRGVITGYRLRDGNGVDHDIQATDVVRFFFPDPESLFQSEGYLGPSGITADSLKFAGQHLRAHYQSDATPKTVLKAGEGAQPFSKEERLRFEAMWRQKYSNRNGNALGPPAMLPVGYDIVQLALMSGADITPLLEYWRADQLMSMGVPRSVLGEVVSGDRSSAETNQYVFDLHTISPIAGMIADALTLQLAPDFDSLVFVAWAPFISGDKTHELAQESQDLTLKVRSVNQVREDRGLDPVEWGEQPVGSFADTPYTGDAYEPLEMDVPEEEEPPPVEEPPRARSERGDSRADLEWERVVRREKKYVPLMRIRMARIFDKQKRSVLKKLKQLEPRTRVSVTAADLFTPQEWVGLFEKQIDPIRAEAYRVAGADGLAQIAAAGFDVDTFIFTAQSQLFLANEGAQLVKYTGKTTQRDIARALMEGNAQGEGVEEIANRIKGVFEVRQYRARTIARTELLKATQSAQQESFEQSGVVEKKQWNTSRDDAVRDSHISVDGQVVGLRENFTLGDEELAYEPGIGANGAVSLSAANTINCRCFLTPVFVDEGGK